MNMFFTPDKTFLVSLKWNEDLRTFVAIEPDEALPIFELATPTERLAHEQYHGLMGLPLAGGLDRTEALMWGQKDEQGRPLPGAKGLVRSVRGMPAGTVPTPALTTALARLVREECGMAPRLTSTTAKEPSTARMDAEGNSDSPSGSGLDSTPNPAGSAETPSGDRPGG